MNPMISSNTGNVPAIPQTNLHKRDIAVDNENGQLAAQATALAGGNKQQQTLEDTVQQLQKAIDAIQGPPRTLEFSIHEKTNAIMIKVMNKETGDLIREVPPEKILDLAAKMMEITGIIVDKKI
ncbi:flagellar protein FlaG [Paenibacillus uliginis N3/975]|uniref:Flagellar protein FlaG n=1 Tax=Paenibacillus uliginis N3/975 TaxID=1313296 RepID=A0A1X7GBU7_9BACL|nr:flagellar protein FlaG [Paenibacillus uliginis]SMF67232.1 flagellar protein FlaG [Paenibacillus uliginis N3/975]